MDEKKIHEIAELCKISLSDEETKMYSDHIQNIIKLFDQLAEINTEGIKPLYQVFDLENVWRSADEVGDSLAEKEVFANSPDAEDHYFQVPAIREG